MPLAYAADYSCNNYEDCTDGGKIYLIVKDGAPIRKEPNNKGEIVAQAAQGTLISVKRIFWTMKMTRWAELNIVDGESLYVHIDNIAEHSTHAFLELISNDVGTITFCPVCGVSQATITNDAAVCDMTCVADQAIKGSFSDQNPTFAGILGQIIVGEIPGVGTVADIRDLVGDIMNGESVWVIGLGLLSLLPVVGAVKYCKKLDTLKYADEVADVATTARRIPWGTWSDYKHVTLGNGNEYAKIGDFLYTKHAVEEFASPSAMLKYGDNMADFGHARGVSPSWVDWILTEGVETGVTTITPNTKNANRMDYICGSVTVIVENENTVVSIITKKAADYIE